MSEKTPLDDRTVGRLLSGRDGPSVLEKEQLFERIYQGTFPSSRAPQRAWFRVGVGAAAVVAVALGAALWLRPSGVPPGSELTARGVGSKSGESFQLLCSGAPRVL